MAPTSSKAWVIAAPATRRAMRSARNGSAPISPADLPTAGKAPALTSLSTAPIPWTEDELFAYLRTGTSRHHGVAAGPMAPVVKELAALPETDIRAMAVYLASFNGKATTSSSELDALATRLETETAASALSGASSGARIYQGACAVCHQVGGPQLFGARPSLALNSNLHGAVPDNLIQVILHGIADPVSSDLGYMPAFKGSFSDNQVADLVRFLRRQFCAGQAGVEQWSRRRWRGSGTRIDVKGSTLAPLVRATSSRLRTWKQPQWFRIPLRTAAHSSLTTFRKLPGGSAPTSAKSLAGGPHVLKKKLAASSNALSPSA